MKALVAAIFAAGLCLAPLSSAQAITVAADPLAGLANDMSSVIEVQSCGRGTQLTPTGCRPISYGYKSKKKRAKKK
jgi:hypothetical protein